MAERSGGSPVTEFERRRVGACVACIHARRIESARGSLFYRCGRAKDDPRYPDYPPLPVTRCAGFEERA